MSLGKNKILHQAGAAAGPTPIIIDIDNFDIANRTTFNPTAIGIYTGGGCQFGDSGNKFYASSEFNPTGPIYQYNTPSAYTLPANTATHTKVLQTNNNANYMTYLPTADKLFAIDRQSSSLIYTARWDLSIDWDISTGSLNSSQRILASTMSAKVTNGEYRLGQFVFNSDGTNLYVAYSGTSGNNNKIQIHRYALSTAYDISGVDAATADSTSGWLNINTNDAGRGQMSIDPSETQILYMGISGVLCQIDLTTVADLSTASLTKTRNSGLGNLIGLHYNHDEEFMTTAGDGSGLYHKFEYIP